MLFIEKLKTGLSALPLLLLVVLAAPAFADSPMRAAAVQRQVADQLADFKRTASELRREAETLNSHTGKRLSWESHSHRLGILKDHVNQLGGTLAELETLKPLASEGQEMAIEHSRPHLVSVAQKVTRAIELLSENRGNIHWTEYGETVSNISAHADELYIKLDTIMDFENAKMRLEALELQPMLNEETDPEGGSS